MMNILTQAPRASVELHKYYDELHDAFDRYLNEVQRVNLGGVSIRI